MNAGLTHNQLSKVALDIAFDIHRKHGPGYYESIYESIFCYELAKTKIPFQRQMPVKVFHDDVEIGEGFRADVVMDGKVILELKSVSTILPVHEKQLQTYLKATGLQLGLVINFNEELMKHGIRRVVNGLKEEYPYTSAIF